MTQKSVNIKINIVNIKINIESFIAISNNSCVYSYIVTSVQ